MLNLWSPKNIGNIRVSQAIQHQLEGSYWARHWMRRKTMYYLVILSWKIPFYGRPITVPLPRADEQEQSWWIRPGQCPRSIRLRALRNTGRLSGKALWEIRVVLWQLIFFPATDVLLYKSRRIGAIALCRRLDQIIRNGHAGLPLLPRQSCSDLYGV